jgi:hypothetical protein
MLKLMLKYSAFDLNNPAQLFVILAILFSNFTIRLVGNWPLILFRRKHY